MSGAVHPAWLSPTTLTPQFHNARLADRIAPQDRAAQVQLCVTVLAAAV